MKVILMGPPGSGKGTQASKLASILDVESISSGDLFRSNLSNNTDLGVQAKKFMDKGEYVPDDITINMVMSWVEDPLHDKGFNQANGITNVNFITDKILIAPQGYSNEWNVGYQTSKADDIAFIDSI